jgi:cytochrome P450
MCLSERDRAVVAANPAGPQRADGLPATIADYLRYMRALVRARTTTPRDDQISELASALHSGGFALSEDELVVVLALNLLAGAITSLPGNLTAIINTLVSDPSRWRDLTDCPGEASAFVEEALRFDNQGGFFRTTTRDVALGGIRIPAGKQSPSSIVPYPRVRAVTQLMSRDAWDVCCDRRFGTFGGMTAMADRLPA